MKRSWMLVGVLTAVLASMLGSVPVAAVTGTEPVTTVAAGSLTNPFEVAVDADGNLYIADTGNHRIQKVDTNNVVTTVAGGNGQGSAANQLSSPRDVAVDADGNLYIADQGNHRIQKVDTNNVVTTVAGGNVPGSGSNQLNNPYGVGVDADGNIYIADTFNHRIQEVDTNNVVTTVAGGNGQGSAANQLSFPMGLGLDADGNLYIADQGNHRIQEVDTNNVVTTVAGGNGQGSAANQLSNPHGVAVDTDGNLYIADNVNARIQKLTADTTPPVATITTASSVDTGDTLTATFSCNDVGTSGLATCTATLDSTPIDNGDPISTANPGTKTLVVTAVDNAGNTATATRTITITTPAPPVGSRELTGAYAAMSGDQGSVARLYMAVFNRQPDANGHAYWVGRSNNELTLRRIADFFIASPEFGSTYNTLNNAQFVDLLYHNVMDRPGDTGGVRFWNEQLDAGTPRSLVVLQFSESPEFKTLTKTT